MSVAARPPWTMPIGLQCWSPGSTAEDRRGRARLDELEAEQGRDRRRREAGDHRPQRAEPVELREVPRGLDGVVLDRGTPLRAGARAPAA
jgi:hypothetical protein